VKRIAQRGLTFIVILCIHSAPSEGQTCTHFEEYEIYASHYVGFDQFGSTVVQDGEWLAVGADEHVLETEVPNVYHAAGAVFVYRREDTGVPGDPRDDDWVFFQELVNNDGPTGFIGYYVDVRGEWIVAGEPGDDLDRDPFTEWYQNGSVHVWRFDGSQWVQLPKLIASDAAPHPGFINGPYFGTGVSVSAPWIAVGQCPSPRGNDPITGNVYLFRLDDRGTPEPDDDEWVEHVKIPPPTWSSEYARFGDGVALDGDLLVVGAPSQLFAPPHHEDGAAYVYEREDGGTPDDLSDDQWVLRGRLIPSDDEQITSPVSPSTYRAFGLFSDIEGPRVLVGASSDWPFGAAYVFQLDDRGPTSSPVGQTWHEEVKLLHSDRAPNDLFGAFVDIRLDRIALGNTLGVNPVLQNLSGTAYSFRRVGGHWIEQQKVTASDPHFGQNLGTGGALADGQILVGARNNNDFGTPDGSVYVFKIVDDCDRDCISDADEIAAGTSLDCDGNGIPDECEDCDGNGLANACDIAACPPGDLSCADCNDNELPDGCEVAGYFDGPAAYAGPGPSRRDCNDNGIPDDCDLANCPPGEAWCADCNGNRRPDVCDRDCNGDGVPDNCVSTCTDDCECWDGWECTRGRCVDGACAHEPALFGDVDDNGYVNVMDILCVLGGFAGSSACAFEEIDLVPCGGNGQITIFDLFAVLDVFKGVDPCCGG